MPTDDVPRPTAHARPAAATRHHLAAIVAAGAVAAAVLGAPRGAGAQMLATPVLQNAFVNRGVTVAANFGSVDKAQTYALAAAWAPGSQRFALSAGAGVNNPSGADNPSRPTYGARLALPLRQFMDGALGVAAFVGIGGAAKKDTAARVNTLPAGVAVGYRRPLGAASGLAVYAAPFYAWTRSTAADGGSVTRGLFRVSGGVDLSLSRHVGATFGAEVGAEAKGSDPGPHSAVYGIGLSYAFQ